MLDIKHLHFQRGIQKIFSDLTFSVAPGCLLQVTGANGAGKSTLLKIIVGLMLPTRGALYWCGKPIKEQPTFINDLLFIGHKTGVPLRLTPLEHLTWWALLHAIPNASPKILTALAHLKLHQQKDKPLEHLSLGQRQRLALAYLWLKPAQLWILDEPYTGLDEEGRLLVQEALKNHLQQGGMAIVASHTALFRDSESRTCLLHLAGLKV